jgi:hypothetical protein
VVFDDRLNIGIISQVEWRENNSRSNQDISEAKSQNGKEYKRAFHLMA